MGDAIESALSETGGTRDIGLYRTPDHIRQLMVAMVDPQFNDVIFDPACGTGGFLFDSFQYVIERVTKDGKWPGPKTHPELQEYFKNYFAQFNGKMPTADTANAFYRNGAGGIEYLGMIRKMAAVNLFIRGLNPNNIEQGDSLKMFNPASDAGSKSIVIANPPFGAERDQSAYPNVWEEYSKESETTILFVKLMFDLLKKGGRCAVIVSEGFLTWDQNSAKALRKILLDEANLKTIISLPQGVFVSKGGQGAKTSILYFEKGEPTKHVWFYKIENDGYTMGVNRKPTSDSQIPEIIGLFTKHVRKGVLPSETKNSFAIPSGWIKTLDPRIKDRIRKDTRETLTIRSKEKRNALVLTLDARLAKGRIDEKTKQQKLWEFDTNLESRIQNEIAKNIDKAYAYSLNLTNYKSGLREEQIQEWKSICHCEKPEEALNVLDKLYEELQVSDPAKAQGIICSLDPKNALEMDIAREYLIKHRDGNDKLKRLEKILKKGFAYPRVKLEKLLTPKYDKIKKENYQGDLEIIEKITFEDGAIHFRETRETGMDLYRASKGELVTSKINVHQGAVALAPMDLVCSTHYQIYEINGNEVHPDFLVEMLRSQQFVTVLSHEKNKGIKNEQGSEFLLRFQIPLPLVDIQREIISDIERQRAVEKGSSLILDNWRVGFVLPENCERKTIEELTTVVTDGTHQTPSYVEKGVIFLSAQNIKDYKLDFENIKYVSREEHERISRRNQSQKGDILLAKSGTLGVAAIVEDDTEFSIYESLALLRPRQDIVLPRYLYYVLNSQHTQEEKNLSSKGMGVKHLHLTEINKITIPVPDLSEQKKIIGKLDCEMNALEKVRLIKSLAAERINEIIQGIWQG